MRRKKRKGGRQSGLEIRRDFKVAFGTYLFIPIAGQTRHEHPNQHRSVTIEHPIIMGPSRRDRGFRLAARGAGSCRWRAGLGHGTAFAAALDRLFAGDSLAWHGHLVRDSAAHGREAWRQHIADTFAARHR
jgi:hypothetical protein